jgi:hypothetical protein
MFQVQQVDGMTAITEVFWTKEAAEKCRGCHHQVIDYFVA